jgi:type IV pilus assembly protein PilM
VAVPPPSDFAVAYGLALHALGRSRWQTINLLPPKRRVANWFGRLLGGRRQPESAWGIDLGRRAAKAIRLRLDRTSGRVTIADHRRVEAGPGELPRFDAGYCAQDGPVALAVPLQQALVRSVLLPPIHDHQFARFVEFEARQTIPFPLAEVVWSWQQTGPSEVLLCAARRQPVDELLGRAGGSAAVSALLPESLATADYLCGEWPDDAAEAAAVLNVGGESSEVVFVASGRMCWGRIVGLGGAHLTRALARERGLSFEEAELLKCSAAPSPGLGRTLRAMKPALNDLANEVLRGFGYFRNSHPGRTVRRLVLIGGGARLPFLSNLLSQAAQVEVVRPTGWRTSVED